MSLESGTGNFHLCGARSYALAMHDFDFDLLVLGAGSGGVAASRRAAALGARVGLIEAGRVGGTCVLRGCVPKKLLVYGSHFRDDLEDAAGFGWSIPSASLDWSKLVAAKDREVSRLNGVYLKMLADSGVHLFFGWGRLIDAHTVEIRGEGGSQRLTARYLLIATGSSPIRPAIPGADLGITSDEALSLPGLPRRAVIVGGGYIGVEFAGIFSRAGVEVSQVLRCDNILRGFDEELRAAYASEQRARGIALHPNQTILAVEPTAAACVLASLHAGALTSVATGETIMAGLNCGTPTSSAWPVLAHGLDGAVAVTDVEAAAAAHDLRGAGIDSGPCGAATLAGLRRLLSTNVAREALGLSTDAIVVLLSTEGSAANPALPQGDPA